MSKYISKETVLLVTDQCYSRVNLLLKERYNQLQKERNVIKDLPRIDDVFIPLEEVETEEKMIRALQEYLKGFYEELREKKSKE